MNIKELIHILNEKEFTHTSQVIEKICNEVNCDIEVRKYSDNSYYIIFVNGTFIHLTFKSDIIKFKIYHSVSIELYCSNPHYMSNPSIEYNKPSVGRSNKTVFTDEIIVWIDAINKALIENKALKHIQPITFKAEIVDNITQELKVIGLFDDDKLKAIDKLNNLYPNCKIVSLIECE